MFYISPAALLADHLDFIHDQIALQATVSEMWPGLYFWGYPFTAIAVAALPAALLAYERDRRDERVRPWAPLLGLLCAWLQPWQGATLLVILLITEMFLWRVNRLPRLGLLAATAFATVAPLCYYAILSRLDASWTLAGEANRVDLFPSWTLALSLAPLAIPAAFAYTRRPRTFQGLAVRIWAPTAVAIYFVVGLAHVGTFPLHALQGLSIPLAVLAVAGATAIAPNLRPAAKVAGATVLVVVLVAPALVRELDRARGLAKTDANEGALLR